MRRETSPRLRRSLVALAVNACLMSGIATAQSNTSGTIFGSAPAGTQVQIENIDTGLKRQVVADENGKFRAGTLPVGRYKVVGAGETREGVRVNAGAGSEVDLQASIETITVRANAYAPIDVSSVETATILTAEDVEKLPINRDITSVSLLAPGAVAGNSTFGNLASFGGSSVAENTYYINGFNVTNLYRGLAFTQLPFEAIQEQQVKTGGYSAEFGRSTGGVINVITKQGGNAWDFGSSAYYIPEKLVSSSKDVYDRNGNLFRYNRDDSFSRLRYNFDAGGPIIKDRLFVYGLYQGTRVENTLYDTSRAIPDEQDSPLGLVKLNWNITDNHLLEFTGLTDKRETKSVTYKIKEGTTQREERVGDASSTRGGENYIGRYTGLFGENFTLSALYGVGTYERTDTNSSADCPFVEDLRAGSIVRGCSQSSVIVNDEDERKASRVDIEWQLGAHRLRAGLDNERITTTRSSLPSGAPGDLLWRYSNVTPGSVLPNGAVVPAGVTQVARTRDRREVGDFDVDNTAQYIEDNWQITDDLLVILGLRNETFDNKNAQGESFLKIDRQLAPRLGFSWNVSGDSSLKIYGNAGRYNLPIPSNVNVRVAGNLVDVRHFYTLAPDAPLDPVTGVPVTLGTEIGGAQVISDGPTGDARELAAKEMDPMYQDEFSLGFQKELGAGWAVGVRGIYRSMGSTIEDTCQQAGIERWAGDNGYTNFDPGTIPPCLMLNPGEDAKLAIDLNNDGNLSTVTIPASYLGVPKAEREYRAVEFTAQKGVTDKWYVQGSYTWSRSYGNTEGFVRTETGQPDSANGVMFDTPGLMDGSSGYLPNDQRHSFKLWGYYALTDEWSVGGNASVGSGHPLNCTGVYPENGTDPEAAGYGAESFYCGGLLVPRGTAGRTQSTRNVDLNVRYTPVWAGGNLTLGLDVFNAFNFQRKIELDQEGESDERFPSPSFLLPVVYQTPRYFQFSARYDFGM